MENLTTTTVITQVPNPGAHYGPARSMLKGTVSDHDNGMAEVCTCALEPELALEQQPPSAAGVSDTRLRCS